MAYQENHNNPEGSRRVNDPPDGAKRKLSGVVDSVPPDMVVKCRVEG